MSADLSFSNLIATAQRGWLERQHDDGLLSLALPLDGIDPLQGLPQLAIDHAFRVLWDSAPGLCFAAAGHCQQLELAGARRFELAQRFADLSLSRLTDTKPDTPALADPGCCCRFNFLIKPVSATTTPTAAHPCRPCCPAGNSAAKDDGDGFV